MSESNTILCNKVWFWCEVPGIFQAPYIKYWDQSCWHGIHVIHLILELKLENIIKKPEENHGNMTTIWFIPRRVAESSSLRLINVVDQYQVDQNNNSPSSLPYFLSLMVLRIWYTSIYVQMYNAIENTSVLHMCVISRIHGLLLNTLIIKYCNALLWILYQGTHPTRQLYFLGYTQSPKGSCVYLENSSDSYGIFHTIPLEIVASVSFFSSPVFLTMCWHCNRNLRTDHSFIYLPAARSVLTEVCSHSKRRKSTNRTLE